MRCKPLSGARSRRLPLPPPPYARSGRRRRADPTDLRRRHLGSHALPTRNDAGARPAVHDRPQTLSRPQPSHRATTHCFPLRDRRADDRPRPGGRRGLTGRTRRPATTLALRRLAATRLRLDNRRDRSIPRNRKGSLPKTAPAGEPPHPSGAGTRRLRLRSPRTVRVSASPSWAR